MSLEKRMRIDTDEPKFLEYPNNLEALNANFLKYGHIATKSSLTCDEDINRVITLKTAAPNTSIPFNGYFAYGRKEQKHVIFDIYIPQTIYKTEKPSLLLITHTGLFMHALVEKGYHILELNYNTK